MTSGRHHLYYVIKMRIFKIGQIKAILSVSLFITNVQISEYKKKNPQRNFVIPPPERSLPSNVSRKQERTEMVGSDLNVDRVLACQVYSLSETSLPDLLLPSVSCLKFLLPQPRWSPSEAGSQELLAEQSPSEGRGRELLSELPVGMTKEGVKILASL